MATMMEYSKEVDQGFFVAAFEGDCERLRYFHSKGADVLVTPDKEGRKNPLRMAAIRSHFDAVKCLVEELGVDPSKDTRVLQMTIMASDGSREIFEYLLSQGADINTEDPALGTSLMLSCRGNPDDDFVLKEEHLLQEDTARWLVELGADVSYVCKTGEQSTAVHKACEGASLDLIKFLIENGGEKALTIGDKRGFTPLICAAAKGRNDVVSLLIEEYNCDPDFFTEINAMFMAVQNRKGPTVELLVQYGADPSTMHPTMQCFPLHIAASNEFNDIVLVLLKTGAPADCEDPRGYTPLFMAASEGYSKTCQILLHGGADPNHRSHQDNSTAVFHAVLANRLQSVKVLLMAGADPLSTRGEDNKTLAEMSREKNREYMANLLEGWVLAIESGKDPRKLCGVCCKFVETPKRCSRCKSIWYCTRHCQKKHWAVHKTECKPAK
eukprot:TRINITY_DN3316_c1_g2_i1.p1 TRINITY_DN3316_c1_g2~~TRINITY_DN3316_c1_g2_i1.p1  ORF type:complete len:440 (+),score=87.65 TRINITY_DN3316_c1_g2_i1:61-1380(+)